MPETMLIRGGRVIDAARRTTEPRDIVVSGDTIRELEAPGAKASGNARVIDATGKLLLPGLIYGSRPRRGLHPPSWTTPAKPGRPRPRAACMIC